MEQTSAKDPGTVLNTTKFDGSLHYHYPVQFVERTAERLVTFSVPGIPVRSYRGSRLGKQHLLAFFWPNRPYVLHALWDADWQPESLYVDIAIKTKWDDHAVGYIDMDLDVILPHGKSVPIVDDEDEFEEHRVRWNYPQELVDRCHAAVDEVRRRMETRDPPFTQALFAWRPGMPLP